MIRFARSCAVVAALFSNASCLAQAPAGTPPAPQPSAAPVNPVPSLLAAIDSDPRMHTLAKLVKQAQLEGALNGGGTMTFFAPTETAFAKLPGEELNGLLNEKNTLKLKAVLDYHLLFTRFSPAQLAQQVQVTTSDNRRLTIAVKDGVVCLGPDAVKIAGEPIQCLNGILYPVDQVLAPAAHDLMWTIEHDPRISIFSQMLKSTGTDALLREGRGRFTVLAPTDEALQARLDAEYLRQIMAPDRAYELNKIVRRHIIPGTVPSKVLGTMKNIPSLAGEKPAIAVVNGIVTVNGAKLVVTDLPASNGLIDLIDDVMRITPPEQEHLPIPPPPPPPLSTDKPATKPAATPSNSPNSPASTPPSAPPVPH